jgi:hypothetical protein
LVAGLALAGSVLHRFSTSCRWAGSQSRMLSRTGLKAVAGLTEADPIPLEVPATGMGSSSRRPEPMRTVLAGLRATHEIVVCQTVPENRSVCITNAAPRSLPSAPIGG